MKNLSFDAYTLKLIAVIAMVLNHITLAWLDILPVPLLFFLYGVGGLTYPIMAFFVVEGYRHTSNLKKYIFRLAIFGLIAQIFHPLVMRGMTAIVSAVLLNIMFTIILSIIVLILYDKIKIRILFWLAFLLALILAMFMDWYFIGILLPLMYHSIRKEGLRRTLPAIVAGVIWLAISLMLISGIRMMQATPGMEAELELIIGIASVEFFMAMPTFAIGCFLSAFLIKNYNGKRGKSAKWLFYVAYPLHLAVLGLVAVALGFSDFGMILSR